MSQEGTSKRNKKASKIWCQGKDKRENFNKKREVSLIECSW